MQCKVKDISWKDKRIRKSDFEAKTQLLFQLSVFLILLTSAKDPDLQHFSFLDPDQHKHRYAEKEVKYQPKSANKNLLLSKIII